MQCLCRKSNDIGRSADHTIVVLPSLDAFHLLSACRYFAEWFKLYICDICVAIRNWLNAPHCHWLLGLPCWLSRSPSGRIIHINQARTFQHTHSYIGFCFPETEHTFDVTCFPPPKNVFRSVFRECDVYSSRIGVCLHEYSRPVRCISGGEWIIDRPHYAYLFAAPCWCQFAHVNTLGLLRMYNICEYESPILYETGDADGATLLCIAMKLHLVERATLQPLIWYGWLEMKRRTAHWTDVKGWVLNNNNNPKKNLAFECAMVYSIKRSTRA